MIHLAPKVWRKLPTYGHVNQSCNLKKGVNAIYWIGKRSFILSLYEEERSLENRSYDVSILGSGMTSYIHTTQFYNKLDTSNLERYLYVLWSLRLETNRDDWRAMPQAKIRDRKRKRNTGWTSLDELPHLVPQVGPIKQGADLLCGPLLSQVGQRVGSWDHGPPHLGGDQQPVFKNQVSNDSN